jgi:hypothetical protein
MSWISPVIPRRGWPLRAPERETLDGLLDFQRDMLRWRCGGLDGEQLARRAVEPSSMSLLGIVRHMAKNERVVLRICAAGQPVNELYPASGEDFDDLDPNKAESDFAVYDREALAAREAVRTLDVQAAVRFHGESWSLRSILQGIVVEYAQHNGHADLLRERIDAQTGDYF